MLRQKKKLLLLPVALLMLAGLCGCGESGQAVGHRLHYVPDQELGIFDQENHYRVERRRAGREFPDPLPEDGFFSIHATEVTHPILFRTGRRISENGAWIQDLATGETVAWVENGCPDGEDDDCRHRLFDLEGNLLLDWDEAYPYCFLGRWLFVCDSFLPGDFSFPWDGRAVDPATGEVRFEHYFLGDYPVADGIYDLQLTPGVEAESLEELPAPVLLVDQELQVLRQFDDYKFLIAENELPYGHPGYLSLWQLDGRKLYSAGQDLIYPGEFIDFVSGEEPLGLFFTDKGCAVYRLEGFERLTEFDTSAEPCYYTVYTPAVQIFVQYLQQDGESVLQYVLVGPEDEEPFLCDEAGWTVNGFYAIREGRTFLFDREGALTEVWEPSPLTVCSDQNGSDTPPKMTAFSWDGYGGSFYVLYNRAGGSMRGEGECEMIEELAEGRYRLLINKDGEESYSLVDEECRLLLHDVDGLYSTGAPGLWEICKGSKHGIVDEAGYWCWELDIQYREGYTGRK